MKPLDNMAGRAEAGRPRQCQRRQSRADSERSGLFFAALDWGPWAPRAPLPLRPLLFHPPALPRGTSWSASFPRGPRQGPDGLASRSELAPSTRLLLLALIWFPGEMDQGLGFLLLLLQRPWCETPLPTGCSPAGGEASSPGSGLTSPGSLPRWKSDGPLRLPSSQPRLVRPGPTFEIPIGPCSLLRAPGPVSRPGGLAPLQRGPRVRTWSWSAGPRAHLPTWGQRHSLGVGRAERWAARPASRSVALCRQGRSAHHGPGSTPAGLRP